MKILTFCLVTLLTILGGVFAFAAYQKPDDEVLKQQLTPMQYRVTQEGATEPPYKNLYWDNKRAGIYVDVVSGEPLFSSLDKYDSKTGWPSFTKPLIPENLVTKEDNSWFFNRTEVLSRYGGSHLGHVFKDGPPPTHLRYCINSAALEFIPVDQMKQRGYGQFLYLFEVQEPDNQGKLGSFKLQSTDS